MEVGFEVIYYYDLLNLIFFLGVYICVVDIDKEICEIKVCCFVVIDDCGNIINLMIV